MHRLFIKHWPVSGSAIIRFPHAAAGCTNKKRDLPRGFPGRSHGGDAAAHGRRSDVARAETGDRCRAIQRLLGVRDHSPKKHGSSYKKGLLEAHEQANYELFGSGSREAEDRVIDRHVSLGLINNDLLLIGVALSTRLNRGRNKNAADFFVVA